MSKRAARLILLIPVLFLGWGAAIAGQEPVSRIHNRCWTIPGCGAQCSCRRDDCRSHCGTDSACLATCDSNYQSCLESCL